MTVSDLLLFHVLVIGFLLAIVMCVLIKENLFSWLSAGFWAWLAFVLYFFIPPLYALYRNDVSMYKLDLSISGGITRGLWMLLVLCFGITVFFIAYLKTKVNPSSWNLTTIPNSLRPSLVPVVMLFFLTFGIYSLFLVRGAYLSSDRKFMVEGGRFVGEATGWEYNAHMFVIVPILFLMASGRKIALVVGGILGIVYIVISALDPWGRYTVLSMMIAVSMVIIAQKGNKWPNLYWVVVCVFITLVLQARGHTRFEGYSDFVDTINTVPDSGDDLFLGGDTAMLRTLYIESYVYEKVGYDYGIPTINYAFLGFLPSRFFPNKYMLIEWLEAEQGTLNDPVIKWRLYGAKSSLVGSFYGHAGLPGVLLFMGIAGILSRRLDALVRMDAPDLVRSTGISLMSVMWMVWGSSDTWAIMVMGILSVPTIFIWLISSKQPTWLTRRHGDIWIEHTEQIPQPVQRHLSKK